MNRKYLLCSLLLYFYAILCSAAPIIVIGSNYWPEDDDPGKNIILTSNNGVDWEHNQIPNKHLRFEEIVQVGKNNYKIYSCFNNWVFNFDNGFLSDPISIDNCLSNVFYDGQLYIGLETSDDGDTTILSSTDGIHFEKRFYDYSAVIGGITHSPDKFVAVSSVTNNEHPKEFGRVYISTDGLDWKKINPSYQTFLNDVIYHDIYVAVGSNILISKDGLSWNTVKTNVSLNSIAYGNQLFVTVGNGGSMYISDNGSFWQELKTVTKTDLQKVFWNETHKRFIALGYNGTLISSEDGKHWKSQKTHTDVSLYKGI